MCDRNIQSIVSGVDAMRRFVMKVGAHGPRLDALMRVKRYLMETKENTNVDTLPIEMLDQARVMVNCTRRNRRSACPCARLIDDKFARSFRAVS